VVTGGSRGIGLEIAGMLLAQKAKVVICGRKHVLTQSRPDDARTGHRENC
jgi:NAD(P)-dependent dehydrogenase (short-subunit alcohol dehydrogenase family)